MKTFSLSVMAAVLLAINALSACKKNSSPPVASANSKLSFQLQATNSTASLAATSDTASIPGLTWTAGKANIGRFAFEAKRSGVSINILSQNLTNVDLFALTPLQTYVTLDTGVYTKIVISAFLESTDTIPPLKLSGTFKKDSSKLVPIQFELSDHATVKVSENNIDINGTTNYTALLNMQLNKLTKDITAADLKKASLNNGSIVISKSSNSALYYKMKSNIAGCVWSEFKAYHKDSD